MVESHNKIYVCQQKSVTYLGKGVPLIIMQRVIAKEDKGGKARQILIQPVVLPQ